MTPEALVAAYRTRNGASKKKLVFHLTGRGFASELNVMLSAMLYCLEHEMEFCLYSKGWNGAVRWGWRDYFQPFCRELSSPFFYRKTALGMTSFERVLQRAHSRFLPNLLTTHQVWGAINDPERLGRIYDFPDLGIHGDVFHAKRVLLNMVYRFNERTQKELAEDDALLAGLKPYVAAHARRGDKVAEESKEADRFEAEAYLEHVEFERMGAHDLFLATDDHAVIREFEAVVPAGVKVASFCDASSAGHVQKKFNKQSRAAKRAAMRALFRDIRFLAESELFIGTFSSNIGRLVALFKNGENCLSIDEEWNGA